MCIITVGPGLFFIDSIQALTYIRYNYETGNGFYTHWSNLIPIKILFLRFYRLPIYYTTMVHNIYCMGTQKYALIMSDPDIKALYMDLKLQIYIVKLNAKLYSVYCNNINSLRK